MHIPFHVKWVVLLPEESCTVKTSLVVTHFVFVFFFLISITKVEFCEYVCNLLVCLMKFG